MDEALTAVAFITVIVLIIYTIVEVAIHWDGGKR